MPAASNAFHHRSPSPGWSAVVTWILAVALAFSPFIAGHAHAEPKAETPKAETTEPNEAGETPETEAEDTRADLPSEEREALEASVARPVPADPIQVFGWREKVKIGDIDHEFHAKLDTGALTSSMHAENIELFERDGNKWVRFIATDPRDENAKRIQVEAPLVRYARIKNVGGGESDRREVVRLRLTIGTRKLRGEFTLTDRSNMLVPVLIGRTMLKDLGWVDSSRTYLAEQEIFR